MSFELTTNSRRVFREDLENGCHRAGMSVDETNAVVHRANGLLTANNRYVPPAFFNIAASIRILARREGIPEAAARLMVVGDAAVLFDLYLMPCPDVAPSVVSVPTPPTRKVQGKPDASLTECTVPPSVAISAPVTPAVDGVQTMKAAIPNITEGETSDAPAKVFVPAEIGGRPAVKIGVLKYDYNKVFELVQASGAPVVLACGDRPDGVFIPAAMAAGIAAESGVELTRIARTNIAKSELQMRIRTEAKDGKVFLLMNGAEPVCGFAGPAWLDGLPPVVSAERVEDAPVRDASMPPQDADAVFRVSDPASVSDALAASFNALSHAAAHGRATLGVGDRRVDVVTDAEILRYLEVLADAGHRDLVTSSASFPARGLNGFGAVADMAQAFRLAVSGGNVLLHRTLHGPAAFIGEPEILQAYDTAKTILTADGPTHG